MGQTKVIRDRENSDQMPEWLNDVPLPTSEGTQLPRLAMPTDLKKLSITKGSIAQLAMMIIQHSQEQGLPAYNLKAYSKYLELLAKEISDRVSDEATDELAKEISGVGLAGMTLAKVASAGKWDFEHIPEWIEKANELKEIEETAKLAYTLSTKKKIGTGPGVVGEDGEVMTPAKFYPGKDTVKITVAK